MLSKKTSILCSSYNNLQPLCYYHYTAASPPTRQKSCRHTFAQPYIGRQTRGYAQHAEAHIHQHDPDLLHWPEAIHPHTTPTPYQILKCKRGDAYSKHRFYALAKLYHPDRCHPSSPVAHLSSTVRLERYRMVVAAHDILSDVEKRRAYDILGRGWAGHPAGPGSFTQRDCEFDSRRWSSDPRYNATWEDWERWYRANEGHKEPEGGAIRMSNFAFVSLVVAFVCMGGVAQGTRFGAFNSSMLDKRDERHRQANIHLQRSKHAALATDQDERIRTFMDHREATLAGEAAYHRLLPPADNCAPDAVRRR